MTNVSADVSVGFHKGFGDQENEVTIPSLEIESGARPPWLSGTLVRNGPARFRLDDGTLNHWFDGLAMLHRFDMADGRVSYTNKFLDTPARRAIQDGKMRCTEFATDPCRSLFKRIAQQFVGSRFGANANVTVGKIADEFVAQTEVPMRSPSTRTPSTRSASSGTRTGSRTAETAHPHYDREQRVAYNYLLKFGAKSSYGIYELPDGSRTRRLVGEADVRKPSYMHSFAISAKYAILMEFPLVVSPLRLLLSGKPFIENYQWEPERGTRFSIVDRSTGDVTYAHTDEAWFGFHTSTRSTAATT